MKTLDAIKIAKWRFDRRRWQAYFGNRWRTDRRGWRQVIRNVKRLCEKRGFTLKDFDL